MTGPLDKWVNCAQPNPSTPLNPYAGPGALFRHRTTGDPA